MKLTIHGLSPNVAQNIKDEMERRHKYKITIDEE